MSILPFIPSKMVHHHYIRGADGASVVNKQVEANNFTTYNGSVTISRSTALFDTPLPQFRVWFDVDAFEVITIPVKN